MESGKKNCLKKHACNIRLGIIEGVYHAKSGHPGGSLSSADLFAYLYAHELRVDPRNPKDPKRDRFVLSKGHCAPGLYSTLAEFDFFDKEELKTLRKIGSKLQGHPNMNETPGVDMSTGSLGQGISSAVGMALGAKIDKSDTRVYALLGDGEMEEGQVWEAAMFAAHKELDNLCIIVDNNGLQIDGTVEEVAGLGNVQQKLSAFGFEVFSIDGHDFDQIELAFNRAKETKKMPTAIVMKTVKGKGISFMEDQVSWHGNAPNENQYNDAVCEIKKQIEELGC